MIKMNIQWRRALILSCVFLFSGSGLLMYSAGVSATDWTQVFIEGANSHDRKGKIKFKQGAYLSNAPDDGVLPADKVEGDLACLPRSDMPIDCTASNIPSRLPLDRIDFEQCMSGSKEKVETSDSEPEVWVTAGDYEDINLKDGSGHKLGFITNGGVYKIKKLKAESGTLEFAPGQYWIEDLEINADVNVIYPSNGTVSWFVGSQYTHNNNSPSYRSEQLLIYTYGDFELQESTQLRAHVVSEKKIKLKPNSSVEGAVSGDKDITFEANSRVIFSNSASRIDVTPNCNIEPPLPAVPLQCPASQEGVAGITYRTYDATSWKTGQDTSPVDHDDFNELLDTVKTTTRQLGESIESRVEGSGASISPHSSQGDRYAGIFEGYLQVPETGRYTFGVDGDDSIELLIDDQVVVGSYQLHDSCDGPCETGDIALAQGTHKIEVRFHEAAGNEAYHLYWQPPSTSSLVKIPESAYLTCPFPQFEFGRVTLNGDGRANITFENNYATAPVVMLMPTINGTDSNADGPSTVRLVSSSAVAASIIQGEPPGNMRAAEDMPEVDYFVMESGYRLLARGKALQAGKLQTKKYQGKRLSSSGRGYAHIRFAHKFGAKPAMLGQTLSRENNRFITTAINSVSTQGDEFDIAIETSEVEGAISQNETLGYVAGLGSGSMLVKGELVLYEFAHALNHGNNGTAKSLTSQCNYSTRFTHIYRSRPYVIASKNSRSGADGGWVRRCRHTSFDNRVSFALDEDQQSGVERDHRSEKMGYFAFGLPVEAPTINHYRIEFSSDALSCTAKNITIKSCENSDCTRLNSIDSSVELLKDDVKYSDISINGQEGETDTEIWHGEGGLTKIGLGARSPSAPYLCYINGTLVDNSDCSLDFAEAGFIVNIDNYLSNKPQDNIEIAAVKKSDGSQTCTPALANASKSVDFWSDYVIPAEVINPKPVSVNDIDIGNGATNAAAVVLEFDSQGVARIALNYADAGKIALHAKYTAAAGEDDAGLVMEGSDDTVRYPVGLCIKPKRLCLKYGVSCSVGLVAGDTFELSIQGKAWESDDDTDFCDNLSTANYAHSEITLGSVLQEPSDGVQGEVGTSSYTHIPATYNLNLVTQSISEVGVFRFTATPPINYYLGEAITILAAESKPMGRFHPKDFEVSNQRMRAACGEFTYMDQPIALTMTIRARNWNGETTKNYYGDFASATGLLVAEDSNAGVNYRSRLKGLTPFNWRREDAGVQEVNDEIRFTRPLNRPVDGPYPSMEIGLKMHGGGGALIASADMDPGTGGDCSASSSCNAKRISTQHYRHGRIVLDNAYGPEADVLRMPARAEFWDGSQWLLNTLDNCSVIGSAALPATGVNYAPELAAGQNVTRIGGTQSSGNSDFSQGRFELLWRSVIANPNRYRGQVTAPLAVPEWLQWYWNWDNDNDAAFSDPRGSAFFGTYRGHDKVIFWREVN